MEEFKIRTYTKKELALLYFPDSTPQAAGKHLKARITRITRIFFREMIIALLENRFTYISTLNPCNPCNPCLIY